MNKKILKLIRLLLISILISMNSTLIYAGSPPPPPPNPAGGGNGPVGGSAPVGSGLIILFVLGAAYGAKKLYHSKE